ncbi:MAG TPA: hypothetical protein VII49_14620, partial [Rhizomicrobium sp.]
RIWDTNTGAQIAILRGHEHAVNSAAFSADGTRVVTASDDHTARMWNVSAIHSTTRAELIQRTCNETLAHGLSEFSAKEILHAAPVLDPRLDTDACHPPGLWSRFSSIFWAPLSP